MKEVRCPHCKALLFKAKMAEVDILCKCGRLIEVRFFSANALVLTSDSKVDMLKMSERSTEVIEPRSQGKAK